MLPVENNFNKIGLPHVYIALFRCLWVPGGGLEPFRRVLRSDGKPISIHLPLVSDVIERLTDVKVMEVCTRAHGPLASE